MTDMTEFRARDRVDSIVGRMQMLERTIGENLEVVAEDYAKWHLGRQVAYDDALSALAVMAEYLEELERLGERPRLPEPHEETA